MLSLWHNPPEVKTYLPIIVEQIFNDTETALLSDSGIHITEGDILITDSENSIKGSWKLHVQEVAYIEDLFEDYLEVKLQAVTANVNHWRIKNWVSVGDELKLLAHAHEEASNK